MRPFFAAFIAGSTAETERKVPLRLVPMTWSKSSPVISPSLAAGKMPALAQSTSMAP